MDDLKDKIEQIAILDEKKQKFSHKLIGQFDNLEIFEPLTFRFLHNEECFTHPNFKYDVYFSNDWFIISDCIFYEDIIISRLCSSITFENCTFKKALIINLSGHIFLSKEDIKEIDFSLLTLSLSNSTIENIRIENTNFESNIRIVNEILKRKINNLEIIDSTFEKDFIFHNAIIKNAEIKNCDFNSLSEFINVEFTEEFDFQEITYKGFSLFDDCIFNTKVKLKYIIFEKFTSFRNSIFNQGINLDYTSSDKDVNFYGAKGLDSKISKQNTSQETYRIIKNQFEKLNNKIEANEYHALELDQRKKELEKDKWKNFSEYVVFKIHDLSSKHSTSYFRAVLGIIFVGLFTISWVHFDIVKDLFFHPSNFKFEYLPKIWSEFWQYINITNLEKLKDKPFIFFFNKVFLGYLYYQFVTAVRKDTRK